MEYILFAGLWLGCIYVLIYVFVYYYRSKRFLDLKKEVEQYIGECNELNDHIEDLKSTYINFAPTDYGSAIFRDNSVYRYKRNEFKRYVKSKYVYNCSLSVCRNAQQQPFKYLCKYFNITPNEETLNSFEETLNNFSAAEQGKILLKNKREDILKGIWKRVPFIVKFLDKNGFQRKLGFKDIDFSQLYFPTYTFNYISSGGNSSMRTSIVLDINNLNKFVVYLSELVKFRQSVAGQRALMTTALREKIKERDSYTCRFCKNSTFNEPNLLLEIDHIIPLSRGGMTTENNLQTLCWKCNRNKGSRIIETPKEEYVPVQDQLNIASNGITNNSVVADISVKSNNQKTRAKTNTNKEKNNNPEKDDLYKKLVEYKKLLDDGVIDQEEFSKIKKKLLDE